MRGIVSSWRSRPSDSFSGVTSRLHAEPRIIEWGRARFALRWVRWPGDQGDPERAEGRSPDVQADAGRDHQEGLELCKESGVPPREPPWTHAREGTTVLRAHPRSLAPRTWSIITAGVATARLTWTSHNFGLSKGPNTETSVRSPKLSASTAMTSDARPEWLSSPTCSALRSGRARRGTCAFKGFPARLRPPNHTVNCCRLSPEAWSDVATVFGTDRAGSGTAAEALCIERRRGDLLWVRYRLRSPARRIESS
jgi:hypothetical protein